MNKVTLRTDQYVDFYCCYDGPSASPQTFPDTITHSTPSEPVIDSPSSPIPLSIQEQEVHVFSELNSCKAPGPDGFSPSTLRHCVDELTPVFMDNFNTSSITIPKNKSWITGLNDDRPLALTSVVNLPPLALMDLPVSIVDSCFLCASITQELTITSLIKKASIGCPS